MSHSYEPSSPTIDEQLELLITQFRGQPNITGLIRGLLDPYPELLQAAHDLFYNRWLENAAGEQLDLLGTEVGLPRQGRSDDEYRTAIRIKIFINASGGLINEQLIALAFYVSGDHSVLYEFFPAAYSVTSQALPENVPRNVYTEMSKLSSAGVKLTHVGLNEVMPIEDARMSKHDEQWSDRDYFHGFGALGPEWMNLELSDGSVLELSDGSELIIWDGTSEDALFFGGLLGVAADDELKELSALELSDESVLELSDGSVLMVAT